MKNRLTVFAAGVATACSMIGAQTVTFNSPVPWMTTEDPEIVAKTLLDTAIVAKKGVELSLVKVESGRERVLAKKKFAVKDYSQEFTLGKLTGPYVGGTDYLKIVWTVPGDKNDKGTLEPFGYVSVDEPNIPVVVKGIQVSGELTVESGKSAAGSVEFVNVGGQEVAMLWNKTTMALVCKAASGTMTFCLDGKNGKNAFLGYSDWFITTSHGASPVKTYHYKRTLRDTGVVYEEAAWLSDVVESAEGGITVVLVPWHDTGIIPFVNRRFGIAAFSRDGDGRVVGALPGGAVRDVPGTWGDCELRDAKGARDES